MISSTSLMVHSAMRTGLLASSRARTCAGWSGGPGWCAGKEHRGGGAQPQLQPCVWAGAGMAGEWRCAICGSLSWLWICLVHRARHQQAAMQAAALWHQTLPADLESAAACCMMRAAVLRAACWDALREACGLGAAAARRVPACL
jgi:hypothetical protein